MSDVVDTHFVVPFVDLVHIAMGLAGLLFVQLGLAGTVWTAIGDTLVDMLLAVMHLAGMLLAAADLVHIVMDLVDTAMDHDGMLHAVRPDADRFAVTYCLAGMLHFVMNHAGTAHFDMQFFVTPR